MYLFLICLSFLSHVRLPSSLFSVPWFSVVRLSGSWSDGFGCGLMGDGRGWWWRWFYGRRLWSDGHESWVRRSNDRGGGSAWVVGRGSPIYWVFVCVLGFGSPIWWYDGFCFLWVLVHRSTGDGEGGFFFFFGLWSWFWFSMSCGSPIYWVCMCDGFWFTDLVWWVLVRRALLVGSDRGCWGGGFWLLFVPWFLFFYFGGWGLRLWLVVVVVAVAVAVAVGGGGSWC